MASGDWRYLLRNKVVFITGAAGWIARHIVKLCHAHQANVVISDINIEEANKLKDEIVDEQERLFVIQLDLSNEQSIEQAVKSIVDKWKTIDVLINTAAIFDLSDIERSTSEQWDRMYTVDLRGYALTTKHVVPILKQNNNGQGAGNIINIASISGVVALPNSLPYGPLKAAVLQLTRSLALDLGSFNIRVNSVTPGSIDSPAFHSLPEKFGIDPTVFNQQFFGKCLKRLGNADEIANTTVFLASDLCQFMTGTNLIVDGGYTIV